MDEDSGAIFDQVFSSVMKELKAMGKYLKEGSVDTDKVLHPTIEKSFPRGNDLAENPPKKKAWWKIRMN